MLCDPMPAFRLSAPRRVVPIAPGELATALRRWETAWADAARWLPDGLTLADAAPLLVLYDRLQALGVPLAPEAVALMESVRRRLTGRPGTPPRS